MRASFHLKSSVLSVTTAADERPPEIISPTSVYTPHVLCTVARARGGVGPICEVPSLLPHANASAQLLFNINGGERYPAPHTTATPPRPPADRSLPDSEKQKRGITVTQAGGERSPQHL